MNSVIGISIGMAAASYEILGIIGYLTFGNKVTSNIIAMYPASSLIIAVGRLGIVLLVGLSYPLQVLPCRVCVNTLTRGIVKTPRAELPTDPDASVSQQDPDVSMSQENTDEEELNLLPKYGHDGKEIKRIGEIRQWKFYIITVGILTCGFLVALSVDELEVGESKPHKCSSLTLQCLVSWARQGLPSCHSSYLVSSTSSCLGRKVDR
jgi:amino acid permease